MSHRPGATMPHDSGTHAQLDRITVLAVLTLLSPLAGMVVDVMLANRFGASAAVDAFRITYLVVGFGTQLLVNQLLPNLLVPIVAEYRAAGEESQAWEVAWAVGAVFAAFCAGAAILLALYSGAAIGVLGPGLHGKARADAVILLQYCGWALIPTVWTGIGTGLLNVYRIFYIPPLAQVATNICLVSGIAISGREWSSHVVGGAILAGASCTIPLQLLYLWRIERRLAMGFSMRNVSTRIWRVALRTSARGLPLVLMVASGQLGNIVANRELNLLGPGLVATFNYAWRLQMMAALMPWCLGIVAFPAMSEAAAVRTGDRFPSLAFGLLRATALVAGPIVVVLFFIRQPLTALLFQRGAMNSGTVALTCKMFGLLLALTLPGALIPAIQKIFFALKNTACPSIVMAACQFAFAGTLPWAARRSGVNGVIFVLAIGYWLMPAIMLWYLHRRYHLLSIRQMGSSAVRLGLVLAAVAAATWPAVSCLQIPHLSGISRQLAQLAAGTAAAGAGLYFAAKMTSFPEVLILRRYCIRCWLRFRFQLG